MSSLPLPDYALHVTSWRREVHALYAAVRAESPAAGHALWVEGRNQLFRSHPASPRTGDQQLRHAEYNPGYRFVVPIRDQTPERWEVTTGTDGLVPFERIGSIDLSPLDTLDVWWLASYGGGIFVPLRDATAGSLTYGAGRYLLDTVKGADLGRIDTSEWIIDLNFAYNPSCVYDARWACPLAPSGNRLSSEVPVGELLPLSKP
jgi:uncharacterized protein (DUF1684 family)